MEEKIAPAIGQNSVILAEHQRNVWHVVIPSFATFDRVMQPEYWLHSAMKFSKNDKVELRADDGSWYAECLIDKVSDKAVTMWPILHVTRLNETQTGPKAIAFAAETPKYLVKFGGPHKWRIVRTSDLQVIHSGEPNEAAAKDWLQRFLKGEVEPEKSTEQA